MHFNDIKDLPLEGYIVTYTYAKAAEWGNYINTVATVETTQEDAERALESWKKQFPATYHFDIRRIVAQATHSELANSLVDSLEAEQRDLRAKMQVEVTRLEEVKQRFIALDAPVDPREEKRAALMRIIDKVVAAFPDCYEVICVDEEDQEEPIYHSGDFTIPRRYCLAGTDFEAIIFNRKATDEADQTMLASLQVVWENSLQELVADYGANTVANLRIVEEIIREENS